MDIQVDKIGKRYRYEWIFKDIGYHFKSAEKYAILGPNGSGKSTLMRVLSGHLTPSHGQIRHQLASQQVAIGEVFHHLSYAAPYIDLIEELSLWESLRFHQKFKPFISNLSASDVWEIIALPRSAKDKELRFFSSGMKQRVKLALAILSDTPLLLLDEPTTNLDVVGMDWYLDMIEKYSSNRTLIIASNEERDYGFCDHHLSIMDYKPKRKKG